MTKSSRTFVWQTAAVLLASFVAQAANAADVISRKEGKRSLAGAVASIATDKIVINTGLKKNKPQTVPVNDIVRIKWDGEPGKLDGLRNAEAAGRLKHALDGYNSILADSNIVNENLRTDLTYFVARTTARMAEGDPTKTDDAIAKLEAFRKTHADSYHYYELLSYLGRVQLAKKNYAAAKTTFGLLGRAPWKDVQLAGRNETGRVLLAEGKPQEALTVYADVLTRTGSSVTLKAIATDATLGKAACLQKTAKSAEAVRVLDDVIARASKTDSRMLAGAYVLQGDCYLALGRTKEARMAYLRVDVLFPTERQFHPKALYHLAKLWTQTGYPARAEAARLKLETDYPNSEWTGKN